MPVDDEMRERGLEGSRLDWRFLIPDLERAVVLNLDPDPTTSFDLAHCCRRVVRVNRDAAQATAGETRPANLSSVNSEAGRLPLTGQQFDLIFLGRLLESRQLPAGGRGAVVRQLAGLLRPNGRLVLLAESPSFLGALRRSSSRGAGPGLRGYKRLLHEAGLETRAAYWIEPSCESPRHWIRLEHRGPAMHYLSGPQYREGPRARLFRTLLRGMAAIGGASRFASNFLIVGGPAR